MSEDRTLTVLVIRLDGSREKLFTKVEYPPAFSSLDIGSKFIWGETDVKSGQRVQFYGRVISHVTTSETHHLIVVRQEDR